MLKNPNYIRSSNIIDSITTDFPRLNFKTIFDAPDELETLVNNPETLVKINDVEEKNKIPIEKKDMISDKPKIEKNPNINGLESYSKLENANKNIQDTINANEALKDGNYDFFEEIMGRPPTIEEIRNKSLSVKTLTDVLPKVSSTKEVVSISFDDPYGEDKKSFDKYLQKLISEGKTYKLQMNADGSLTVSYSQTPLLEKKVLSPATDISKFIIRFNLLTEDFSRIALSRIEKLSREDLSNGLELLGVEITPELFNDKKEMKVMLREELVKYIDKNEDKIEELYYNLKPKVKKELIPDGEEKEITTETETKRIGENYLKRQEEEIKNQYNRFLLQKEKKSASRLPERIRDLLTNIDKNNLENNLSDENKRKLIEMRDWMRKNNHSLIGKGFQILKRLPYNHSNLKKRIEIAVGEIEGGNDNPLLKKQLKTDLSSAVSRKMDLPLSKEKIRDLVKKLL
jgi:hypothetical protein